MGVPGVIRVDFSFVQVADGHLLYGVYRLPCVPVSKLVIVREISTKQDVISTKKGISAHQIESLSMVECLTRHRACNDQFPKNMALMIQIHKLRAGLDQKFISLRLTLKNSGRTSHHFL